MTETNPAKAGPSPWIRYAIEYGPLFALLTLAGLQALRRRVNAPA